MNLHKIRAAHEKIEPTSLNKHQTIINPPHSSEQNSTKTENQKRETHTVIRKIIIPTLYQTVAPYMHSNPSLQTFLYRKEKR